MNFNSNILYIIVYRNPKKNILILKIYIFINKIN